MSTQSLLRLRRRPYRHTENALKIVTRSVTKFRNTSRTVFCSFQCISKIPNGRRHFETNLRPLFSTLSQSRRYIVCQTLRDSFCSRIRWPKSTDKLRIKDKERKDPIKKR